MIYLTIIYTTLFDVESFYRFIHYDIKDDNVGKMLQLMQDSMSATLEKKRFGAAPQTFKKVNHSIKGGSKL